MQLMLAFLGGGFLTTLVQNRREDRHRHTERKLAAASEALAAFYDVYHHSRSTTSTSDLYAAGRQFTAAVSRMTLLFGTPVSLAATKMSLQVHDMLEAVSGGSEAFDLAEVDALLDFQREVRVELGVDRPRQFREVVTRYWPRASR